MWVQMLAKCPAARVAIQPPSVEYSKDWGKWRRVRSCSASWASRPGPVAPASMQAESETSSSSSSLSRPPMSIESGSVVSRSHVRRDAADDRGAAAEGDRGDARRRCTTRAAARDPPRLAGGRRRRGDARTARESPGRCPRRTFRAHAPRGHGGPDAQISRSCAGTSMRGARSSTCSSATGCSGSPELDPKPLGERRRGGPGLLEGRLLILVTPAPVLAPARAHRGESMRRADAPAPQAGTTGIQ